MTLHLYLNVLYSCNVHLFLSIVAIPFFLKNIKPCTLGHMDMNLVCLFLLAATHLHKRNKKSSSQYLTK